MLTQPVKVLTTIVIIMTIRDMIEDKMNEPWRDSQHSWTHETFTGARRKAQQFTSSL